MSSVFRRNEVWYVRYKDHRGTWRSRASTAGNKTEARRLAGELEQKAERQRLGLEPIPDEDGGGSLGDLLRWWLETYADKQPSGSITRTVVEARFLESDLAELRLVDVTPAVIETFLQAESTRVSPSTINHYRAYLSSAFTKGKLTGRWSGENPVRSVPRRKVPKRLPDYLRVEEVPLVLAAIAPRYRSLFATAIYTGMRKGELAGLRKADVDFRSGLIYVQHSYARDTTKGGQAAAIPLADELRPYLERAIKASGNDLVFPGTEGEMLKKELPLEEMLRRALGRAGIVTGYTHVCRKKGCGYAENASDRELRHCPTHGHKLWPKAHVRPIRFHDLRHTTASLLMAGGANPGAVQKIMRHSDPRITMETYAHLAPNYLRSEIDRLSFGPPPPDLQAMADVSSQLVTTLLQAPSESPIEAAAADGDQATFSMNQIARPAGFEPATTGFEGENGGLAGSSNQAQGSENVQLGTTGRVQRIVRKAGIRRQLVTSLLQDAPGSGAEQDVNSSGKSNDQGSNGSVRLMTVKEVAGALRICTATVYSMIGRGELEHIRVSNAIRVVLRG